MKKFWDLYEKNVVISGFLAIVLVGTACFMFVKGMPIPPLLAGILGSVIGYFFGAGKATDAITVIKGKSKD